MIRNTMAHAIIDQENTDRIHDNSEIDVHVFMGSHLKNENFVNMLRAL